MEVWVIVTILYLMTVFYMLFAQALKGTSLYLVDCLCVNHLSFHVIAMVLQNCSVLFLERWIWGPPVSSKKKKQLYFIAKYRSLYIYIYLLDYYSWFDKKLAPFLLSHILCYMYTLIYYWCMFNVKCFIFIFQVMLLCY